MAKQLATYELMMALKPLLPDDVRKVIHKDVLDLVKAGKGKVIDTDVWGKRYLAYKIQGHNEGYYLLYQLELDSTSISEMKRKLELKQEILRFMIVKIEKPEELGHKLKKKEMEEV